MKKKCKKRVCIAALALMAVLALGSTSNAAYMGSELAKGDIYLEVEEWDYTGIISDDVQMSELGNADEGYLANKGEGSTKIKMTVSTGENSKGKLEESANTYVFSDGTSGKGVVFSANEENPWEAGANISLYFVRSEKAFFYCLTAELGFSGNAPKAWKLQVSYDNGTSYIDVEGSAVSVKKDGYTEVLFERVALPKPLYEYIDYFNAPDPDVYSRMPYRLRLVAVSEGDDDWEGSTSGEVCVKKISLGEWGITIDDPVYVHYPEETEKNQNQQTEEPVKQIKVSKPVLKVKASGKKKVNLTWKKIDADGYEIYQKTGSGKFKKIKTLKAGKTKYVVKKLKQKTYTFKIRAFKGKGKLRVYSDFSKSKKVKMNKK